MHSGAVTGKYLMDAKDSVLFRCPHCGARVRVNEQLLGNEVTCANPDCGRPFFAEAPVAQPIMDTGEDADDGAPTFEVDRVTRNDEERVKVVHPSMWRRHPFRFLGLWALVVLGCVMLVAGILMGATWLNLGSVTLGVAGLVIAAAAGLTLLVWWVKIYYTMLIISTRRSIFRQGIISRATTEVQHDDVRNLQMDQNTFERIMGVGDISISSAGQEGLEIQANDIPHPEEVVSLLRQLQ
jgi:hypothetical protein